MLGWRFPLLLTLLVLIAVKVEFLSRVSATFGLYHLDLAQAFFVAQCIAGGLYPLIGLDYLC